MTSITPTFSFAQNATPNVDTMQRLARSLVVTGVSVDSLAADLLPINFGNTSQATGAITPTAPVGTVWIDAQSNIWVQESSGPVKMVRQGGGIETRRLFTQPSVQFSGEQRFGAPVAIGTKFGPSEDFRRSFDQPSTLISNTPVFSIQNGESYDDNLNGRFLGALQDTTASSYGRVCLRGISEILDLSHANSMTWSTFGDLRGHYRVARPSDTSGAVSLDTEYMTSLGTDLTANRQHCWKSAPSLLSSVVSNANPVLNSVRVYTVGWLFGPAQYVNRSS